MNQDLVYHKLLNALNFGCPICVIINQNTSRLIDDLLYERVNDPATRKEIRAGLGFCNHHAWKLQAAGDAFSHSIIYVDILNNLITAAESVRNFENIYTQKQLCLFCEQEKEIELNYLNKFVDYFYEKEFLQKYIKSNGLCLPHIQMILKQSKNEKFRKDLLKLEKEKMDRLVKELKEIIRRSDYRFNQQELGKEKDAWIRAIEKISGSKKV